MFRLFVIYILTIILELGLLPGLFVTISTPELFIPVIICLAVLYDPLTACAFSVFSGLSIDIFFMKGFGIRTLLFFSIAYFISHFREKFSSSSIFVVITLTLFLGFMYQILYFLIINAVGESIPISTLINGIFSLELPILMFYSIIAFSILNRGNKRR